ncbi:uncharacterized protein LOC129598994 isoform X2 [Paramacrobiotus metropolitanus]|uniref:uncharacterized protein LOC129598994 isoform X2 n=1 Tax=Paramacrobiotus metropolitanus TaxID=2943436 RepID=UPI002445B02B|nr:uncharacterized protein LOC129598994 isoform X2 [Paramacrobiotus metropolitanus]
MSLPGFGDFFGASAGRPRAGIDSLLSRYNTARLEVPFAGDAGEAPFEAAVVSPTILGIMDFHEADLAPLFGQPGPAPPRTIRPRQHFMNSQRDPSTLVAERRMTAGGVFPDTLDTTDMPSPLPVLSSQSGTSSPSSSGYADIPPPLIVPASAPPPPPVSQPIGDESPRQSLRLLIKRKDGELSVSPGSSPTKVASCSPVKAPEKTETISQGVTTTPPKIGVTRHQGSPKGTGSAGSVKVVTSGTAEIPLADPPAARTPLPPTKMVKMEKRLEKVVKRLKESQSAEKEEKSRKDKAPVKSPAPQTQTPSPAAASKPGSSGHSSHSASTSRPPNTPTPPPDGRNKKVASRGRGRPQKITYTAPTDSQVEQMKKLKAGIVDLTSSNSILATARLDKIDWRAKLEMLPAAVQHELVSMLPATWRGEDAEGRMSLLPGLLSKTDMEWRKQVEEYQKNLLSGEYDTEVRRKYVDHALAQMDPWKVQNFEPLYGDLLRQRLGSEGAQPSPRSEDASTPE